MGFREFVACVALIQATIALAIDMMVPALGHIGAAMHLGGANTRQWVITAFLLGFGSAQLFYGVLADRFGRRHVLIPALALYIGCSFACGFAPSFFWLLAARFAQGVGGAGAQVLATAIIRDCYAGRRMAEVNSLAFMVFLAAPIFAPSLGQLVLLVLPWPAIFFGLGLYACLILAWVALRLPETQHPGDRRAIALAEVWVALRLTLSNRMSLFYTLASALMLGGWLGFINSAQQVFAGVFRVPTLFPAIFAACSVCMAIAALANSRLVARYGMRKLSHLALCGYIAIALAQAVAAQAGRDTLVAFALLQSGQMFCFGLMAGNFGAISMEPLGEVAGTAAAVQGFVSMLAAACIGYVIGQHFDGTVVPLTLGFCASSGLALGVILLAERGRLFQTRPAML